MKTVESPAREPILGCIADDVTGATDLGIHLAQGGMRVVQFFGIPDSKELEDLNADAIVIALKTRSIPATDAISQSLQGLFALTNIGVERIYFKYCSTFDSTEEGNIGPVAEALMKALKMDQTVFCPALPTNGRTVYQGHLFANGSLLNESGMELHPLNPMKDANLIRILSRQSQHQVGLVPYEVISTGKESVSNQLQALAKEGKRLIIVDANDDQHLKTLSDITANMKLVTGSSGLARYLPEAYRREGLLKSPRFDPTLPKAEGRSLILSGSCSNQTARQVEHMIPLSSSWRIYIPQLLKDPLAYLDKVITWANKSSPKIPLLLYSTSPSDEIISLQSQFGKERVAEAIEEFMAEVAETLIENASIRRLIIAGGETSGRVMQKLEIKSLGIGSEICPGVPWTESTTSGIQLAIALKSGNFGPVDFFSKALEMLP